MSRRPVFSSRARREIDRLPESAAAAVIELISGPLSTQPYRVGKALRPPLEGSYVARRGQFRVLYEITDEVVLIVSVSHRRDAYRT